MFSLLPRKLHYRLIAPALLPLFMLVSAKAPDNHPPTAVDDSYAVHGTLVVPGPGILANDTDPDGDLLHIGSCGSVAHGTLSCSTQSFSYEPNSGYVGTDSFTYESCDGYGACDTASVNLSVANSPPVAVDDNYTIHGDSFFVPGPNALRDNDSDPEGDPFSVFSYTQTSHGTVTYLYQYGALRYDLSDPSYVGTDSFSYQICDNLGLCASATVTFNVVNSPPMAKDDEYTINAGDTLHVFGPNALRENDSDPDNDPISVVSYTQTANGTVNYSHSDGSLSYQPNDGFVGADSFTYLLCDNLGLCSTATVALKVKGDGDNNGQCSCNECVGEPVNVTTGNVYLEQNDYQLPGVGPAINVTRSYNSLSQLVGILGRGWSTMYDESIQIYSTTFIRFNAPDGRATYFSRPNAATVFSPIEQDFHGQMMQNGNGSFTLTLTDGSSSQFNSSGRLLSLVDRNGNQSNLSYDANGHLASIIGSSGRVLTVTSNSNGQALSISDTMGTIANYTYGSGNELLSVTYADNSGFQLSYDGGYRLTTVTDALGNTVESHAYNSSGQAVTSERQGGVDHYSLSYFGGETEVTDALGRVTRYTFDGSKGRNVVTQVEGLCNCGGGGSSQVQTWTRDAQLNVTSRTDALGHSTSYTYDGSGNRLTETDATGTVTSTYNQFGEVLTRTDQMGGVTANTYDAQGDLLSTTDARGKTTNFAYDPRGLLLSVTDARGKVTAFAYDASGNLTTRTDALSHATQFVYDARSRLTSVTNALGNVTAFSYDPVGRVTQVTQADGTTISYEYDLGGRRSAMVDAKGNRSTYAYDSSNRLTSETDALNQSTNYSYDSMSNLTATADALGRVTNFDYDDFNRLVKTTYPPANTGSIRLFETIEYDADGNVTKRIDTAGRTTQYGYDAVNRLTSITDPASQVTQYEYNARSEVTALVDAIGQRYRFNHNPVGQITHVRRGTTVMSFTYDAVGNRKERTDYNGALTDYTYDALNRLKTITYPDTTTVSYTYDKLSRMQTAANENGAVDFDYNKMNRLTGVTDVFGQSVDYNYDANGNRTRLSLNAATVATYRYDAVNRLTRILDAAGAAFTFDYDATNKLTQKKAPNNVKTSYQYDGLDRLTRLTDAKGAATVKDHQYQYNTASQITQIAEPSITRSYGYDARDRLNSASYTNPTQPAESYAYDSVGNRTSSQLSASYGYQSFNRLTNTATASYSYDTNGNLISRTDSNGTTQYGWDFENRLRQVTLPNGSTVTYKYDALGRRIQRARTGGVSTNFIYDGQDVAKDLNSDGSTVDYLNGPGIDNKLRLIDSRLAATGPLYFLQDHLGSTTALTNSLGVVTIQLSYDGFGNSPGSSLTRYDYTGRERDPDTGLLYYRARWYDPQVGRFISEDPIGLAGGINQFAYVSNNAQNAKDPTGFYEIDVHYYLTYYLALRTGCFNNAEAREIANGDQGVDENPETKPAYGSSERQRQVNAYYHALHAGSHQPYLDAHWTNATNGQRGSLSGLGIYLHYLQDTFSHETYTDPVCGHGCTMQHYPDKTENGVGKAQRMVAATWDALNRFAKEKKCGCQGVWNEAWWPAINAFLNAPSGNRLREINDGELENKRLILAVPRRY
jgi:RHS repeat-associated protein